MLLIMTDDSPFIFILLFFDSLCFLPYGTLLEYCEEEPTVVTSDIFSLLTLFSLAQLEDYVKTIEVFLMIKIQFCQFLLSDPFKMNKIVLCIHNVLKWQLQIGVYKYLSRKGSPQMTKELLLHCSHSPIPIPLRKTLKIFS